MNARHSISSGLSPVAADKAHRSVLYLELFEDFSCVEKDYVLSEVLRSINNQVMVKHPEA